MAKRRLSVRKIKEVLRLRYEAGLAIRKIARSCCMAHSSVSDLVRRAMSAGISWPLPDGMDEATLEALLYPPAKQDVTRAIPDMAWIHQELRRKGVTLELLWQEYRRNHPNGYQYSRFCELYRQWRAALDVSMRQVHRAGEKAFVDYAGQTVPVVDRLTGEARQAHIFIAVLGASNYTYAEPTLTCDLASWITAHCRAFEFFGGVPEVVVVDNLKTGVTNPCRYEPDLNPTYQEMAAHYGTVVIPARPGRPKDKAKAEVAVQVVERWILAALRNRTFFSVSELNQAIAELLTELNARPFQKLGGSRASLFETLDRPALKPLPATRYEYAEWKRARVNIDYHVEVEHSYYSVPHQLVHQQVDVRLTHSALEVFLKGKRVASHARSFHRGSYSTDPNHMPSSHRRYAEWTPSRMITWAESCGPNTARMVSRILESMPHPEQGFRSCLGIIRLARSYSAQRVEAACERALACNATSYKSVSSILRKGLDRMPVALGQRCARAIPNHVNIRGIDYFFREDNHSAHESDTRNA